MSSNCLFFWTNRPEPKDFQFTLRNAVNPHTDVNKTKKKRLNFFRFPGLVFRFYFQENIFGMNTDFPFVVLYPSRLSHKFMARDKYHFIILATTQESYNNKYNNTK